MFFERRILYSHLSKTGAVVLRLQPLENALWGTPVRHPTEDSPFSPRYRDYTIKGKFLLERKIPPNGTEICHLTVADNMKKINIPMVLRAELAVKSQCSHYGILRLQIILL